MGSACGTGGQEGNVILGDADPGGTRAGTPFSSVTANAFTALFAGGHSLRTSSSDPDQGLFVTGEGRVGIGDATPTKALHFIKNGFILK